MSAKIKALPQGIVEKEISRFLTFKLTRSEVEEYGRKAADVSYDLGVKNDEFDSIKKRMKKEVDNLDAELNGILSTIKAGKEERHVKCIERKDFEQNKVFFVYDGHIMDERPMEDREKQFQIFDHGVDEPKEKEEVKPDMNKELKDIAHHMRNETSVLNG